MKIPFSIYDIFGYLAAGTIVMFSWALASSAPWLQGELSVVVSTGLVLLGYVLGHVLAAISSWLFEQVIVRDMIGPCEELVMNERQLGGILGAILPSFSKALPDDIRNSISAKARSEGISSGGRALFLHCLSVVRHDASTAERLATFLNLYGFSRNASLACFIGGGIFFYSAFWRQCCCCHAHHGNLVAWGVLAVVLGAFLFFRYLKFYRHYTQEVFLSYRVFK